MDMTPQRLSVKFFIEGSGPIDLGPFIPLFHRWIQNNTVEGLLIDVASYQHVPDGPGVLLIGHEVDYSLDLTGGKPGLLVRRKRYEGNGDVADILRDTLRKAALAATALHADSSAGVRIDPRSAEITLIDRLRTPNTQDSLETVTRHIEPVLNDIYPEGFELRHGSQDPRACLSLIATSTAAANFETMLSRLDFS
jgi:hypothetical protein